VHVCEDLCLHVGNGTGCEEEVEWAPGVARRKRLSVGCAHDAEICGLEQRSKFLDPAVVVEVPADDRFFAALHKLPNLLELLLSHGSMEGKVAHKQRQSVADRNIVEKLLRAMLKLPSLAGKAIHGKDAVTVVAKEGKPPEHASVPIFGVDMSAAVRAEILQECRVVVHLEDAADVGVDACDEFLKSRMHGCDHRLWCVEVPPRLRQVP